MPKLYLIRHARPAAHWGEAPDSGLDDTGRQQAEAAARVLAQRVERMPIYTSPLRRCRETAGPLELAWEAKAEILHPVAEIPSPRVDPAARQQWLQQILAATWNEVNRIGPAGSPDYLAWRRVLLESLMNFSRDSVVFTHFVAINAAVGAATSRDDVVCFRPDHASITCLETTTEGLRLVELGRQADSAISVRS